MRSGALDGLIGEYGWDHNVLYILEREGKLHALIEWFYLYPLDEVAGRMRFAFPKSGCTTASRFASSAAGVGSHQPSARISSGLRFPRRPVGVKEGDVPDHAAEAGRRRCGSDGGPAKPPAEAGKRRAGSGRAVVARSDDQVRHPLRDDEQFHGHGVLRQARAFMQRPAAEAVVASHRALREKGYGLLIHDAYRPWTVTKMFWEATPDAQRMFVADPAQGSRHNRGCAVDLTLYDLATGQPVQMVGGYDEFSDRSYPDYPGGTSLQRWHRELLRRRWRRRASPSIEAEWWHFDYKELAGVSDPERAVREASEPVPDQPLERFS